jgi:hypothetical protein
MVTQPYFLMQVIDKFFSVPSKTKSSIPMVIFQSYQKNMQSPVAAKIICEQTVPDGAFRGNAMALIIRFHMY